MLFHVLESVLLTSLNWSTFLNNTFEDKHLAFNIRSLSPTLQQNNTTEKNKKIFLNSAFKMCLLTRQSYVANLEAAAINSLFLVLIGLIKIFGNDLGKI